MKRYSITLFSIQFCYCTCKWKFQFNEIENNTDWRLKLRFQAINRLKECTQYIWSFIYSHLNFLFFFQMYCNSYRKCQWRLKSKWSSQTTCLRMKEPVTLLTLKYCFQMHCLAYLISTLIRIVIVNIVPSLSFSYSKNIHRLTINIQIAEETFKVLINEIDNNSYIIYFFTYLFWWFKYSVKCFILCYIHAM